MSSQRKPAFATPCIMRHIYLPAKKTAGPDGFTGDGYRIFKNEIRAIMKTLSENREEIATSPFILWVIILISKPDINMTGGKREENTL